MKIGLSVRSVISIISEPGIRDGGEEKEGMPSTQTFENEGCNSLLAVEISETKITLYVKTCGLTAVLMRVAGEGVYTYVSGSMWYAFQGGEGVKGER